MGRFRAGFLVLSAGLFSSCGPSARPPPESTAAPRSSAAHGEARAPSADAGAGDAAADAPTSSPVRLEPLAVAAAPAPHVEILFPFAEQRVLIPKAAGYVVRLKVEGVALAPEGAGVELALDGERPRRVLSPNGTKLGDLTAEGAPLAPGPHWLTAAVLDQRGVIARGNGGSRAPFAAIRFWVGERPADAPLPKPHVVLFRPHGTVNGAAAADGALIDFLALPERLGVASGSVRVRVRGTEVDVESRSSSWQPLALRDLPSGDFSVEVELLDAEGTPLGVRASRTITVNREVESASRP